MDPQSVTTVFSAAILVVVLPALVLARSVARGTVSRRTAAIAEELGLRHIRSPGLKRAPLPNGLVLIRGGDRMVVGNIMRGEYRGRSVLLADVQEPPVLPAAGRWGLAGLLTLLGGLIGPLLGWVALIAYPRRSQARNHLVILLVDALPELPDFLIEPRPDPAPDRQQDAFGGLTLSPSLLHEYAPSGAGLHLLPPTFFDRAARVLVGRPNPWTVQGAGGRLAVWISDWRSPTNLRPARSYRAVLDDALSLRDALDPDEPVAPGPPAGHSAGRKSIRAALDRIRDEPGPNHEGRPGCRPSYRRR